MKYLFLSFILLSTQVFGEDKCYIKSFEKIIKINRTLDDSVIIESSCPEIITEGLVSLIENANGKLNSTFINSYFKDYHKIDVSITPQTIEIVSLGDIIQERLGSKNKVVNRVSSLLGKSSFNLSNKDKISITCGQCKKSGSSNVKFNINSTTTWINVDFKLKSFAYRVKQNIGTMTPILSKNDFEITEILHSGNTKLFSDIEHIKFYKLTKHLREGDILKTNDMYPKKLINYGQRVRLTIKSDRILLKGVGIAMKSGKIGEYIEIQNPKSKKIFIGKITNFNEALVEL